MTLFSRGGGTGLGVKLATHLPQISGLRMSGATRPLPHTPPFHELAIA